MVADLSRIPKAGMLCLSLAALLLASGCGASTAKVSGKVLFKGNPVKGGRVTFVGDNGGGATAEIMEDGSYKIDKAPVGGVKIVVDTESINPAKSSKGPQYSPPKGQQAPGGISSPDAGDLAKRYVKIPGKYAKTETSGLAYNVAPGEHNYDIPLLP